MSVAPPSSIVLHLGEENASPLSLAPPLPLERLSVPDELNGRTGSNRAGPEVVCQLAASDDLEAVQAWLGEFHDSPQTLRAYRKEAERLLLWALLERGKPLSSLTREDCILYEVFLADPQPRQRWCGQKAPRFSPRWRPFLGPLSPASRRLAMLIINSLFSYLVKAGYLAGNPLALTRRRGRYQAQRQVERFLEHDQWQVLLDTVEALPRDSEQEQRHYARTRFLVALLYLLGPRVSEVAGHAMSSFIQIRGRWWWRVTGKGQKEAQVPVNQDMLQALRDYRKFYGLPSLPAPDETTPLVLNLKGTAGIGDNMIYRIIKDLVAKARNCAAPQPTGSATPASPIKRMRASLCGFYSAMPVTPNWTLRACICTPKKRNGMKRWNSIALRNKPGVNDSNQSR